MKYTVVVNRKFEYVKVVRIIKKIHDNTNQLSKFMASFVGKYLGGRKVQ